ncbi:MAG: hypothetical protein ACRDE5_07280 [Ginsengibacter sp.]
MNKLVRALIAGWGAKKIGGGCVSTIVVFIIIYYALGTCNSHPVQTQTTPQKTSLIQSPVHTSARIYFLQKERES